MHPSAENVNIEVTTPGSIRNRAPYVSKSPTPEIQPAHLGSEADDVALRHTATLVITSGTMIFLLLCL